MSSGFWIFLKFTPIIVFLGVPFFIFITYTTAVVQKHVTAILPYVSDTGTLPPESCFFSLFFSSLAFIIICASYVRYRELFVLLELRPYIQIKPSHNTAAFSVAIVSAAGLNIVATFQETNFFLIHFIGALICFFGGTAYFVLQTMFTGRIYSNRHFIFYVRCILTSVNIFCTVSTFAPLYSAFKNYKGRNILKWTPEDGGYEAHIASTFSEWILIFSFAAYMCSLYWDFNKFNMEPPAITFKNLDHLPERNESQSVRSLVRV